ncbi:MAG: PsbP-related protein [Patescibacteria group bacterium]|nr:PsbP-related protein [Patescibacteria group bacterium]
MNKKLIVLIIVIIIAILVWTAFLYLNRGTIEIAFSPSPLLNIENHSNWETFVSEEYKFSFEYPRVAIDQKVELTQGYHNSTDNDVRFTVSIRKPFYLIFRVQEKSDGFTDLRSYIEEEVSNLEKTYSESTLWDEKEYPGSMTFNEISINNADGFLIKAVWTAGNYIGMDYYFEKDDYLINIDYDYETKDPILKKYDIIREIISTFKFID